jgi:hypothetical protein
MNGIIPITWYIDEPIDFELKQYTLLAYLQKVDESFLYKKLSPHLLHMEGMIIDMVMFKESFADMRKRFDKNRYIFFKENPKLDGEDNAIIDDIREIVEFSIPQIETRVKLGNFLLQKNKQVLY